MSQAVTDVFLLVQATLPAAFGPRPDDATFRRSLDALFAALAPKSVTESLLVGQLLRALGRVRDADGDAPTPGDRANAAKLRYLREAERAVTRAVFDLERFRARKRPAAGATPTPAVTPTTAEARPAPVTDRPAAPASPRRNGLAALLEAEILAPTERIAHVPTVRLADMLAGPAPAASAPTTEPDRPHRPHAAVVPQTRKAG